MHGQGPGVRETLSAQRAGVGLVQRHQDVHFLVGLPGAPSLVRLILQPQQFCLHIERPLRGLVVTVSLDGNQRRLLELDHVTVGEVLPVVRVRLAMHAHAPHCVATVTTKPAPVSAGGIVDLHVFRKAFVRVCDVVTMGALEQGGLCHVRAAQVEFEQARRGEGGPALGAAVLAGAGGRPVAGGRLLIPPSGAENLPAGGVSDDGVLTVLAVRAVILLVGFQVAGRAELDLARDAEELVVHVFQAGGWHHGVAHWGLGTAPRGQVV